MTKQEKAQFIKDVSNEILRDIYQRIENGSVPDEWGGKELRMYLRDCFKGVLMHVTIEEHESYTDDLLTRNL